MVETAPEVPAPPRRRHWLRGCLIVLVLLAALAGVGIFHTARTLYSEMERDPLMTAAVAAVRADARAMKAIGGAFWPMQHERQIAPLPHAQGTVTTYRVLLIGPRGEGRIDVRIEAGRAGARLRTTFTGPDGVALRLQAAPMAR